MKENYKKARQLLLQSNIALFFIYYYSKSQIRGAKLVFFLNIMKLIPQYFGCHVKFT